MSTVTLNENEQANLKFNELIQRIKIKGIRYELNLAWELHNLSIPFILSESQVKELCDALKMNEMISELNLINIPLNAKGMAALADVLTPAQGNKAGIQKLSLGRYPEQEVWYRAEPGAYESLFKALETNTSLCKLHMVSAGLVDDHVEKLGQALKKNKKTKVYDINLSGNAGIKGTTLHHLALPTLETLDISYTQHTDTSAQSTAGKVEFFNTLSRMASEGQCKLRRLFMRQCGIIDEIGVAMGHFLQNKDCTLQTLNIGSFGMLGKWNTLEGVGAKEIAKGLGSNHSLEELVVDCISNFSNDEVMQLLSESLKQNTTLNYLNLHSTNMTAQGLHYLAGALSHNKQLGTLVLDYNNEAYKNIHELVKALNQNSSLRNLLYVVPDETKNEAEEKMLQECLMRNSLTFAEGLQGKLDLLGISEGMQEAQRATQATTYVPQYMDMSSKNPSGSEKEMRKPDSTSPKKPDTR